MLTVTVNHRQTFRAESLAKAKQQASKIANKHKKSDDWCRIYVSSGTLTVKDKTYSTGSELWMRRFNQVSPVFRAGKWLA